MNTSYPNQPAERDAWVLARRRPRSALDPWLPHAAFIEPERTDTGAIVPVGTVFLTNRECPWRCLMCDLWKNTLTTSGPPGAIPAQIQHAIAAWATSGELPRQLKLYNSGSFFDPRAIPPGDHPAIVELVRHFERVIVEAHPSLVNDRAVRFRDRLGTRLEIAMGLETIHPEVLPRLNKRMTPEQFARAAKFLLEHEIALRVFVLLQPPFLDEAESLVWAERSITFAFECGATVVSLIPTRPGNGALEELAARGEFTPPSLAALETAIDRAQALGRGRVLADLWDLEKIARCPVCLPARRDRLARMNLQQAVEARVRCDACDGTARRSGEETRERIR